MMAAASAPASFQPTALSHAKHSSSPGCSDCSFDSAHSHDTEPGYVKHLNAIIEIAFVAFALYKAPLLLAIGFGIGIAYQATLIYRGEVFKDPKEILASCGQNIGEQFMHRRTLPYERIILAAAFFFHHIDHAPKFFIPIFGCLVGVGVTNYVYNMYKENQQYSEKRKAQAEDRAESKQRYQVQAFE